MAESSLRLIVSIALLHYYIAQFYTTLSHSILLGDGSESTAELRELAAGLILSNPHKYTSALLGRSNTQYVEWLLKDESWGGRCAVCMQV